MDCATALTILLALAAMPSSCPLTELSLNDVIPSSEQILAEEIISAEQMPLQYKSLSVLEVNGAFPRSLSVQTSNAKRTDHSDSSLLSSRSDMPAIFVGADTTGGLTFKQRAQLIERLKLSGKRKERLTELQHQITSRSAELKLQRQNMESELFNNSSDRLTIMHTQHKINVLQSELSDLSLDFAMNISRALSKKQLNESRQVFVQSVLVNYLPSLCRVN